MLVGWGENKYGSVGVGDTVSRNTPSLLLKGVIGSRNISTIKCGQYSNVVVADGNLFTWGYNFYGQLGDQTTSKRSICILTI